MIHSVLAASLSLSIWQPLHSDLRMVLPVQPGESPDQATQAYVDTVNATPELRQDLLQGRQFPLPPSINYEIETEADAPSFAILANEFDHETPGAYLIELIVKKLRDAGAEPYVIPVGADVRLSDADGRAFRGLLDHRFDAMLAVGGADIDPALYDEAPLFVHLPEVRPFRDQREVEFDRAYIADGRGVFYAFCRGNQLAAVSQGAHLIQDIVSQTSNRTKHVGGAWHRIEIEPGSLMSQFSGGQSELWVNSFHHEAVNPATLPPQLHVSAVEHQDPSTDAIVEAVESENRRMITFQFHPEGMNNDDGARIFKTMVDYARKIRGR